MRQQTHLKRGLAIMAVGALPFLAACGSDDDAAVAPVAPPITTPALPPALPPVGEATGQGGLSQEALQGRIGQTLTVNGEVATKVDTNAFTLGGDEIGENPVLVISATAPKVDERDTVRVTGKVIRFSVPGVETDLDLDIVDNEFSDFDGDPALQATAVTAAQG